MTAADLRHGARAPGRRSMIGHLNPLKRGGEPTRSPRRRCSSPPTRRATSTAMPWSSTAASAPRTPITARNMAARPSMGTVRNCPKTKTVKISPISTEAPWRRADRHLQQPAGERARRGGARRGWSRRSRRRTATTRQGGRHPLRGPDLLRRRRHHRVRQADGDADAARGRRHRSRIAPSRWSPRSTAPRSAAGSKSRSAAITASPCRRRSSACPRSSSACCPAPAARSGCRASPGVRRRWRWPRPAIRSAPRRRIDIGLVDRLIEGDLRAACGRLCRGGAATSARCPNRPSARTSSPKRANPAVFDDFRKANARKFRGFDAPEANIQRDRGGGRQALCRRRASTSASCSWS